MDSEELLERVAKAMCTAYVQGRADALDTGLNPEYVDQHWTDWLDQAEMALDCPLEDPAQREPLPRYGDLLTLAQFQADHKAGALLPDDGDGYYATATETSQLNAFGPAPDWATHVFWVAK